MGTVNLTRCTLDDLVNAPNWTALLDEYSSESAIDGLGSQNMQGETYRKLEAAGLLKIIGAWVDGELAGFIGFLLSDLPHYGKKVGISESYFVASAHRKTGAGMMLLKEAETLAAELGAEGILLSAPHGGRLSKVMTAKGYKQTNEVYFKPLGKPSLPAMPDDAIAKVRQAEDRLINLPQVPLETRHTLHAGMYARTITIPAGCVITGALIKIPTLLIVDGHCEVFTGRDTAVLNGYHVLQAEAHRKQVFLAYTDTKLTMIFPTQATTVEQAENEFTDEADMLLTRRTQGEPACLEQ